MNLASLPICKSIGASALIAVVLWLNGLGCTLCGLSCADGAPASATTTTKDCCRGESCRPVTVDVSRDEGETLSAAHQMGCSLLPNQQAAERAHLASDETIAAIPGNPLLLQVHTLQAVSLDPPTPLNRGGTYLRCCALLI